MDNPDILPPAQFEALLTASRVGFATLGGGASHPPISKKTLARALHVRRVGNG